MRVVERYEIKGRGIAIVLDPSPRTKPALGSALQCADGRMFVIRGVEAHAIDNPPPPYGLVVSTTSLSGDAPEIGETVTLIEQVTPAKAWSDGYAAGMRDGLSKRPENNPYRRS